MPRPRNDFARAPHGTLTDPDALYDLAREDELFGGGQPPQSEAAKQADLEDAEAQCAMIRNGWRF